MKKDIEKDILRHGLTIGVVYQLYQSLSGFVPVVILPLVIINFLIAVVLFFLLWLIQKKENLQGIVFLVHVIAMSGFTYFWVNFGGFAGTVPSFLCVYITFIVIVSSGIVRWITLVTLACALFVYFQFPQSLGMSSYYEPHKINSLQKTIDYIVVAGIMISFGIFLKTKLLYYRDKVAQRHLQLQKIAHTLHLQNQELALRQEETRAINDNLESIVEDRTKESEKRYEALSEYAFINAHLLRGPLCRVMGLVNLMTREPDRYPPDKIEKVKTLTGKIDTQISAINQVIG